MSKVTVAKWRAWLQFVALVATGFATGTGATLLALNASSVAYERTVTVGIAAGFAAFVLFILLRVSLTGLMQKSIADSAAYKNAVKGLLEMASISVSGKKEMDADAAQAIDRAAENAGTWLRNGVSVTVAYVGAAASIGLAVGVVGAVISMASVVAAHRQVDRMDYQNKLMQQQIYEATATRVSQVFAAQLPSLMAELQTSLGRRATSEWQVGNDLVGRIQALIYATQPYSVDEDVSHWLEQARRSTEDVGADRGEADSVEQRGPGSIRFSPERGQLLSILVAAKFPFRRVSPPLDFSYADFRGISIGRPPVVGPIELVDMGETVLRGANLRQSQLNGLDLSKTDLSGAVLPEATKLVNVAFSDERGIATNDVRRVRWLAGANLEGALVERVEVVPALEILKKERSAASDEAEISRKVSMGRWMVTWGTQPLGSFYILKERERFKELTASVDPFLAEVGGTSISIDQCNEDELPRLKRFRAAVQAIGEESDNVQYRMKMFLESVFKGYDPSVWECVTKRN